MLPRSQQSLAAMKSINRGPANIIGGRSKKAAEKRTQVNADTGVDIVIKKEKEKKEGKGIGYKQVMLLYGNWRDLMSRNIGMNLIADTVAGSDYGHLKHIISFFGGTAKAFEALELLVTRWKDVQKKYSIATKKDVPSLYLADTLKNDLFAVMCGKSSLTGDVGGSHRADGQRALVGKSQDEIDAHYGNYKRVKNDN